MTVNIVLSAFFTFADMALLFHAIPLGKRDQSTETSGEVDEHHYYDWWAVLFVWGAICFLAFFACWWGGCLTLTGDFIPTGSSNRGKRFQIRLSEEDIELWNTPLSAQRDPDGPDTEWLEWADELDRERRERRAQRFSSAMESVGLRRFSNASSSRRLTGTIELTDLQAAQERRLLAADDASIHSDSSSSSNNSSSRRNRRRHGRGSRFASTGAPRIRGTSVADHHPGAVMDNHAIPEEEAFEGTSATHHDAGYLNAPRADARRASFNSLGNRRASDLLQEARELARQRGVIELCHFIVPVGFYADGTVDLEIMVLFHDVAIGEPFLGVIHL